MIGEWGHGSHLQGLHAPSYQVVPGSAGSREAESLPSSGQGICHWKDELARDVSIYTRKIHKHCKAELPSHTLLKPRLVDSGPHQILCFSDFLVSEIFVIELLESETTCFLGSGLSS